MSPDHATPVGTPVSTESPTRPALVRTALPPVPFTCEGAAAAVGYPGLTVFNCKELAAPRGLWLLTLRREADGATLGLTVAVGLDGRVNDDKGAAAAASWLRARGALADPAVTLEHLMFALVSFDALPKGYDLESGTFQADGVGPATLEHDPFRLTLYRAWDDGGGGGLGERRFGKAEWALGADGRLVWILSKGGPGGWTVVSSTPGE